MIMTTILIGIRIARKVKKRKFNWSECNFFHLPLYSLISFHLSWKINYLTILEKQFSQFLHFFSKAFLYFCVASLHKWKRMLVMIVISIEIAYISYSYMCSKNEYLYIAKKNLFHLSHVLICWCSFSHMWQIFTHTYPSLNKYFTLRFHPQIYTEK